MALVTFRLPDDLATAFAAHARGHGGRSVVLRRLVGEAVDGGGMDRGGLRAGEVDAAATSGQGSGRTGTHFARDTGPLPAVASSLGPSTKVTIRLAQAEIDRVIETARGRGMSRTGWIASLVRARLGLGLPQTGDERVALRAIARELNRIGSNVNQIARAANAEVARSGRVGAVDTATIVSAQRVIETAVAEVRAMLARSAGYWEVDR